jgi:peptidoglycan/LPS O-acetylase OafA/YrhL
MATLAELNEQARGRPAGFDYLRLGLALSIVVWHTVPINYGSAYASIEWGRPVRALIGLFLPMFFALSGFLVAGSLVRCKTVLGFLFLRGIRIFPALALEVCLSALFIGSLFTALPKSRYFSSDGFEVYFLNIFGDIHYTLPGAFALNPQPYIVNLQLWTIPFELKCYIAVAVLSLFGAHLRRNWFLICALGAQLIAVDRMFVYGPVKLGVSGNILVICFLFGIVLYLYRDKVAHHWLIALASLLVCEVLLYLPLGGYFIALPAAYLTVYLGLLNPRRIWLLTSGDYSYAIYLYSYPIQQVVASLGTWTHEWALSLILSFPIIFLVSYCSWHFVESRVLGLRKKQPKIDELWIGLVSKLPLPKRLSGLGISPTTRQGVS